MAANCIILAFFCLITPGSNWRTNSNLLKIQEQANREKIVAIARGELGVREVTGNNDGERVEEYLAITGLKKGQPWCSAFLSWVFNKAGYQEPRTAWSPALFVNKVITRAIKPGNVLGIWFPDKGRIAHAGLVEQRQGDWIISIEGNTNVLGSREGDGVYRKRRHIKTIYRYADWLAKKESSP